MEDLEDWVPVIWGGLLGLILVFIVIGAVLHRARLKALQSLATQHQWQLARSQTLPRNEWQGPPFQHGRRFRVQNVLSGAHRGRPFVAFEYSYTTSSGSSGSSGDSSRRTTTHQFAVYAITMPGALPPAELGPTGIFGDRVVKAFGLGGYQTGNQAFDTNYRVKCDDPSFAAQLLHPAMIQHLLQTAAWNWRLYGNRMISFHTGTLRADTVIPQLDAMGAVLDRIPQQLWAQYGSHR